MKLLTYLDTKVCGESLILRTVFIGFTRYTFLFVRNLKEKRDVPNILYLAQTWYNL